MSTGGQDASLLKVGKAKRRTRAACPRCNLHKIKCLGDTPPCRSCVLSGNENTCYFPSRPRKITMLDTDVQRLEQRIAHLTAECSRLRSIAALSTPGIKQNLKSALGSGQAPDESELFTSPEQITVESSVAQNSSCQVFATALQGCLHDLETSQHHGGSLKIPKKTALPVTNEQGKKHLHLDDKALKGTVVTAIQNLPEREHAISLVRSVYRYFAREFGLFSLKELEFRLEDTYANPSSQTSGWLAYLMIVLAVGEQYGNQVGEKYTVPGMDFFLNALKYFHQPSEEPNLDSVRTLILIAFYSQGLNRMNSVYAYTGLALSTAVAQGIHRQSNNTNLPLEEQEARKRIWWTAFLMDSLWASRLGLLPHFNSRDVDLELPSADFRPHIEFEPKYLIANTKLALLIGPIMKEVYNSSSNDLTYNILRNLKRLEEFFDGLDPELGRQPDIVKENRSIVNLHLRYNQLKIITTRPLYIAVLKNWENLETNSIKGAISECLKAAVANVNIMSVLFNSGWFSNFGFLEAQCCFSTILVLLMAKAEGKPYPELSTAVSLNQYMCEAGNITAVDNYCRLRAFGDIVPGLDIGTGPPEAIQSLDNVIDQRGGVQSAESACWQLDVS
ncbi:LADA_0B06568g1_1 [Lachancea dasiensis]|uniref:LADA_0B06568g1_1 n=1 Tax=Lachancea dasiensis TaxID=1072105 RepID=A0A1G4IUA5_9SACH|nr:LADA_0B06568g1_1 [Lachancea dasiensis]